jgi:cell division protein FtsN
VANKDYVKRGPAAKKAAAKPPMRWPWRSSILAIIVISAFGYGLYTLSIQPAPPVKEMPQVLPKTEKIPTSGSSHLPPPPAEKWDYVETLPKRKIEVVPKELTVSKIPYVMQCGAYKTRAQAEKRKLDIAFQGLGSRIIKKKDSSWYRVVLGPYKFRRDADRDKYKLQRAKIEPCAIWKER